MPRIGFLACKTTVPGKGERRRDAYEHDLTAETLGCAFARLGMRLDVIDWEASDAKFAGLDAVLLGTAWNYQDKPRAFLARLDAVAERGIAVCNPPDMVRWNMRKTYLRELAETGVPIVPSVWCDQADATDVRNAMEVLNCDRLVVKRQVGAGALGQQLLKRGSVPLDWRFNQPAVLQPYLPAITDEGEISFVFIAGEFSHAIRKRPALGDYRIQSLYGGREDPHEANAGQIATARAVLSAVPFTAPLYARIDLVRSDDQLVVMEVELIEPYLYPEQGPELGERLARALRERLDLP